uniref:Uncharacterized protein n=1 Tax=Tetranychus urticae TaxID=32264 RepID=T1L026_TETUR
MALAHVPSGNQQLLQQRAILRTLRREMQATRNGWICNKGNPRLCELNVSNLPGGINDPNIETQLHLELILNRLPNSYRKVSYVMYQREYTTIGVFNNRYKPEIALLINSHQPTWTVSNPVLRPARMYFFARSPTDNNNLPGFTNTLIRMNHLVNDGVTRVTDIRLGPNEDTRITLAVSQQNRNRLLNSEGRIVFFNRTALIYDDLGLVCCSRCYSYDHSTDQCTSGNVKCITCGGPHDGECPFQRFPGLRRCASCPSTLAESHHTHSQRCPSLLRHASLLANRVDFQYNWLLIPVCPTLY